MWMTLQKRQNCCFLWHFCSSTCLSSLRKMQVPQGQVVSKVHFSTTLAPGRVACLVNCNTYIHGMASHYYICCTYYKRHSINMTFLKCKIAHIFQSSLYSGYHTDHSVFPFPASSFQPLPCLAYGIPSCSSCTSVTLQLHYLSFLLMVWLLFLCCTW